MPVFRYALERWERDLYKVFILHRGEMDANASSLSEDVYNNAIGVGGHMNTVVYRIDLNDEKQASDFYDAHNDLEIK